MEWIDELAEDLGQERLSEPEVEILLSTARAVAHRVERRVTPLSTFLLGAAVGQRLGGDTPRSGLLAQAIERLEGRLPPEGANGGTG